MQAWEFFGVVAWMGEKGKVPVEAGLGEKRRYASWRSTEIWKAQKDDREVDVRGIDISTVKNTALGSGKKAVASDKAFAENVTDHVLYYDKQTGEHVDAIITAIDRTAIPPSITIDLYSNGLDQPATSVGRETEASRLSRKESKSRQSSPSAASTASLSPPNREDLRPVRLFKVGDEIWYSEVLRGCSRVKAKVVQVCLDAVHGPLYDIAEKGGGVLRNVRPETCAPILVVGDCLVFGDQDGFGSAMIEEVYNDHWPPRYLCLVNGGLMEVEDEYLYYDEGEEVILSSSSEDESHEDALNTVVAAQVEAGASGGEHVEEPIEGLVEELLVEGLVEEQPVEPENPTHATVKVMRTTGVTPPTAATRRTPEATPKSSRMNEDIVSMTKAEKLCKSAISCISFGDAPAAVRFLQEALDTLTVPNA